MGPASPMGNDNLTKVEPIISGVHPRPWHSVSASRTWLDLAGRLDGSNRGSGSACTSPHLFPSLPLLLKSPRELPRAVELTTLAFCLASASSGRLSPAPRHWPLLHGQPHAPSSLSAGSQLQGLAPATQIQTFESVPVLARPHPELPTPNPCFPSTASSQPLPASQTPTHGLPDGPNSTPDHGWTRLLVSAATNFLPWLRGTWLPALLHPLFSWTPGWPQLRSRSWATNPTDGPSSTTQPGRLGLPLVPPPAPNPSYSIAQHRLQPPSQSFASSQSRPDSELHRGLSPTPPRSAPSPGTGSKLLLADSRVRPLLHESSQLLWQTHEFGSQLPDLPSSS